MSNANTYSTGHPWYYVLGGKILSLKEIWQEVDTATYKGYLEAEIDKASGNTRKLQEMKTKAIVRVKEDISRYRQCALELHRYRKALPKDWHPECDDIHTAMGLKRNHIFNEFANLKQINELLQQQPTLFDFD
jgi:hypothetical protein